MKLKLNKNASIGLAFLISLAIIYFGINFLKGIDIFRKQNNYIAVLDDVSGLNTSSPVLVNGYQVGLVSSIRMISYDPLKFAVEIRLDDEFKIKEGSKLEFGTDLLGGSSVKLKINDESTRYLNPGDTLIGGRALGMIDSAEKNCPQSRLYFVTYRFHDYGIKLIAHRPGMEGIHQRNKQHDKGVADNRSQYKQNRFFRRRRNSRNYPESDNRNR